MKYLCVMYELREKESIEVFCGILNPWDVLRKLNQNFKKIRDVMGILRANMSLELL